MADAGGNANSTDARLDEIERELRESDDRGQGSRFQFGPPSGQVMSQSTFILASIFVAFFVFITARGSLGTYLKFFIP